jgi:hypothetical protein
MASSAQSEVRPTSRMKSLRLSATDYYHIVGSSVLVLLIQATFGGSVY